MPESLFSLLPRLRHFSQSLDVDIKKLLVDQPWVWVQEYAARQDLIFEKCGRVLHSVADKVRVGQWEYLSDAGNLQLYLSGECHLLNCDFASAGLLVLKKEDPLDQRFVLANERIIPDLNIEAYLNQLLREQINLRWLTTESGLKLEYTVAQGDEISVGMPVSIKGKAVPDGLYTILGENLHLHIRNSRISQKIKQVQYLTDKGLVTADSSDYGLSKGDRIHKSGIPVRDNRYILKESTSLLYFKTSNGTVSKIWSRQDRAIVRVGILVLFAIIVLGWRCSNHNDIKAVRPHIPERWHAVAAFSKMNVLPK